MKKVFALIFLASISSPALAMPAIFGFTTNGSTVVPMGVKLNSDDGNGVTSITTPGNSGNVSIDPNPIDIMPTVPPGFELPPVGILPDPGATPGSMPEAEATEVNESQEISTPAGMANVIPMPRGGFRKF